MKHTPQWNCLQAAAVKEQPDSVSRLTLELEVMCCPSMCFDISTQTRSAQLACPLAWITSAPGSPPITDPIYPYMVTLWHHHLAARGHCCLTLQDQFILVHCRHTWSCHPRPPTMQKTSNHEDELCGHSHATWHKTSKSCTCFHNSSSTQACYSPHSSQVHQVHWWLDKWIPRLIHRHWQIAWWIQDLTQSWHPSHDTCPQKMPHHLMPEGHGAPWQDGMSGHDHPCRWTHGLGILHCLCSEGKWWAMPVLGSPWPQWGLCQDHHEMPTGGGSHSWVCTYSLLHQVGCLPWILVNCCKQAGQVQPAYDFQQSLWKIPFPATSLCPGLFPRHLPEEDGPDPLRVPRMHWNHWWHHRFWSISFWYKMMVMFIFCSILLVKSSSRSSIHWSLPMEGKNRGLCRRGLYNTYTKTFNKH